MPTKNKKLSAEEIIPTGLLFEANRRFFHTIGYSLQIDSIDDKTAKLSIVKCNSPEGCKYDKATSKQESSSVLNAVMNFNKFVKEKQEERLSSTGFIEQPIESILLEEKKDE